jgi:hypothetical protein
LKNELLVFGLSDVNEHSVSAVLTNNRKYPQCIAAVPFSSQSLNMLHLNIYSKSVRLSGVVS